MNRRLRRVIQSIKFLDEGKKNIVEITEEFNLTKTKLAMIIHMMKERELQKTLSA